MTLRAYIEDVEQRCPRCGVRLDLAWKYSGTTHIFYIAKAHWCHRERRWLR